MSCSLLIDLGGLKTVFGSLMFSPSSRKDKADATAHELHLLAIITQLFLHTNDVRYLRTLRKFKEGEMIKTERIVELMVKYQNRVDEAEALYKKEHATAAAASTSAAAAAAAAAAASASKDDAVETYARQSEHGLGHVELATIVLAFLATAGEPAVSPEHIQSGLRSIAACACAHRSAAAAAAV